MFELHPNLKKKLFIADLPLSTLLMEDEEAYIWLILVPRIPSASRLIDLSEKEQLLLLKELNLVQSIIWEKFSPTQLNVAAIGNKTPQLHLHVIGRFENDPAWPGTVWDHPVRRPLQDRERVEILRSLIISKKNRGDQRESLF